MTVTPTALRALAGLGVPLGALSIFHLSRRPDTWLWLHLNPHCDSDSVPLTDPAALPDQLHPESSVQPIAPCSDCMPDAEQVEELDDVLPTLSYVETTLRHSHGRLDAVAAHLNADPPDLRTAGLLLAKLRADLHGGLREDGRPMLIAGSGALPPDASSWLHSWWSDAAAELARLQERYTATGVIERTVANVLGSTPELPGPRYVAVAEPAICLTDSTLPAGTRELLLVHDPVAWLGRWGIFRLESGPARVLLAAGRPFAEHAEFSRDAGPVTAGDDEQLFATAASVFDRRTASAPLADPATALTAARDLLAD